MVWYFSCDVSLLSHPNCDRFPLPDIPNGWTPNPRRVWEDDKENRDVDPKLPARTIGDPVDHRTWKTGITADQVRSNYS